MITDVKKNDGRICTPWRSIGMLPRLSWVFCFEESPVTCTTVLHEMRVSMLDLFRPSIPVS